MKKNIKKISFFVLLIAVFQMIMGCAKQQDAVSATNIVDLEIKKETPPVEIKITAVGDVMAHMPQVNAQYDKATNSYDFKNNFRFIKKHIESADLAICNLETTFAGKDKTYSSYPRFNTPDELSDAIKDAGFDYVSIINNHTNDKGYQGYKRTIEVLNQRGLNVLGGVQSQSEKKYQIAQIKGKKIGIISYSYETPSKNGKKSLNGLPVSPDMANLINTFSYENLDKDLEKIKQQIEKIKEEDADFIIVYIHWGEEYKQMPNESQIKISKKLNEYGVDLIFGSHPHVVQPAQMINGENKSTLVFYSLGNIISNQCYEILKNSYTEDGMIANVTLEEGIDGRLKIKDAKYIPTWVHRLNFVKGKRVYEIIPLNEAINNYESFNLVMKSSKDRAYQSYTHTIDLMSRILKLEIGN